MTNSTVGSTLVLCTGTATIVNSTLRGGLFEGVGCDGVDARVTIVGSVVDNTDSPVEGCGGDLRFSSLGHNIESPGDTCGLDQPTDRANVSTDDLKLGPLQDNGGPTETHALGQGSVAIDQIPAEDCVDADGEPLTTDQRGLPRDSMCDVGAFEVQP